MTARVVYVRRYTLEVEITVTLRRGGEMVPSHSGYYTVLNYDESGFKRPIITGLRLSADPYPLYAASNLGSFLALVGYPFLIEPRLTLAQQGRFVADMNELLERIREKNDNPWWKEWCERYYQRWKQKYT